LIVAKSFESRKKTKVRNNNLMYDQKDSVKQTAGSAGIPPATEREARTNPIITPKASRLRRGCGRDARAPGSKVGRRQRRLFVLVLLALSFVGCDQQKTTVKDFDSPKASPTDNVKRGIKPEPDPQVAVIETADFGNIVIELYPNVAPKMVERFKKLIQEGFYDGTSFHRVNHAAGLIQGGDPNSKDNDPDNDGQGNSPYGDVPGEFSDLPYERGTVGAARRGPSPEFAGRAAVSEEQARNTANCQFFITLQPAPQFDEDYTVFGKVISGLSNAEIIMQAPVVEGTERPADKIVLKRVTLEPRSKYVAN
jgi:peptidyl-prolyl cis-trans isomerase B (cyclophilin B)